MRCEEKSNEITAIPELLKILNLADCIVTIDAMGCQTEIVGQIVGQGADYVISLKGNQGTLHRDLKEYLDWAERIKFQDIRYDYFETELEKDHGRIEQRQCWVTEEIAWLEQKAEWKNLKSIVDNPKKLKMSNLSWFATIGKQTHFDYRNFLRHNPRILYQANYGFCYFREYPRS